MDYETLELQQGTEAWHTHRQNSLNASSASAAMGISSYKKRDELIEELATGITEEPNEHQMKIFAEGHRFETLARPLAEKIVGAELYPETVAKRVPGLKRKLSASLDGSAMLPSLEVVNWEHKTLNKDLSASLDAGIIPDEYHPQMLQGMYINHATRCLFMASKWDEGGNLIDEKHAWLNYDAEAAERLINTWEQLEADIDAYVPAEVVAHVVAAPVRDLPALYVVASGQVSRSNLPEVMASVDAFLDTINMQPACDQEYADTEAIAKKLREGAKALLAEGKKVLEQTDDIAEVVRNIELTAKKMNATALSLEKLVDAEKASRKTQLVFEAQNNLALYVADKNELLGGDYIDVRGDFSGVIKGKKNIDSMRSAVDSELASRKVDVNRLFGLVARNLNTLDTLANRDTSLFPDMASLVVKPEEDFAAIVKARIAIHQAEEEGRRLREDAARTQQAQDATSIAQDAANECGAIPACVVTQVSQSAGRINALTEAANDDDLQTLIADIRTLGAEERRIVRHAVDRIFEHRTREAA